MTHRLLSILLITVVTLMIGCASDKNNHSDHSEDRSAIQEVLSTQVDAWNKGDIEGFMQGYWKSDSLLFIGSKITNGWTSTLARYKKSYPDKAAMGILKFDILRMDFVSEENYLVTGRYTLTREHDTPTGIFTLLVSKKGGKWVVVYDHTS